MEKAIKSENFWACEWVITFGSYMPIKGVEKKPPRFIVWYFRANFTYLHTFLNLDKIVKWKIKSSNLIGCEK